MSRFYGSLCIKHTIQCSVIAFCTQPSNNCTAEQLSVFHYSFYSIHSWSRRDRTSVGAQLPFPFPSSPLIMMFVWR